jgi:hypothetical protein
LNKPAGSGARVRQLRGRNRQADSRHAQTPCVDCARVTTPYLLVRSSKQCLRDTADGACTASESKEQNHSPPPDPLDVDLENGPSGERGVLLTVITGNHLLRSKYCSDLYGWANQCLTRARAEISFGPEPPANFSQVHKADNQGTRGVSANEARQENTQKTSLKLCARLHRRHAAALKSPCPRPRGRGSALEALRTPAIT